MTEPKLTQMLLTTMVTNENMKWSFFSPGCDEHDSEDLGDGNFNVFNLLVLAWMAAAVLFFAYWRSHHIQTERVMKVTSLEGHHNYHFEAASISDEDDEDDGSEEDAFVAPSPTKSHIMVKVTPSQMEELEEMEDADALATTKTTAMSPSKRCSLRLALKKYQDMGSGWEDSGEQYSLRVAGHHTYR